MNRHQRHAARCSKPKHPLTDFAVLKSPQVVSVLGGSCKLLFGK
jgi:hypothetical protein